MVVFTIFPASHLGFPLQVASLKESPEYSSYTADAQVTDGKRCDFGGIDGFLSGWLKVCFLWLNIDSMWGNDQVWWACFSSHCRVSVVLFVCNVLRSTAHGGIVVQLALLKLRSPKVQVRGINTPENPTCLLKNDVWKTTLQEINISHLGKRKIIFKFAGNQGDMLIPWKTIFPFELVPFEGDMFIFGW